MPAGGPRRWGFHQLSDAFASQLVAAAGVGPGDLVLDVGAGTGAITAPLVATGARVVAIELHPERVAVLRQRFDTVRVVRADAADLRLPRQPFRVVANPPWSITSVLLRRLTAPGSRLVRADLIVPRQVANRWASPDAPGAARWQRELVGEIAGPVPRKAFHPPPPQPAALLTLRRRGG